MADVVGQLVEAVLDEGGRLFVRYEKPGERRGYWLGVEEDLWGEYDLIQGWCRLGPTPRFRCGSTHSGRRDELVPALTAAVKRRLRRGYVPALSHAQSIAR